MSDANSTFIFENKWLFNDETDKIPENDDIDTNTQDSIPIIEDSILVKEETDLKKDISTYLNIEACRTKDITVNNDKSNNITIDNLNTRVEIKVENDSFSNTNSSLSYSTHEESTSFQNDEAYVRLSNKIEQMSSEYCNEIFKENIYEVKSEIDYEINNIETSRNGLKRDLEDVENHKTIQLNITENNDKSNNITIDNLNTCVDIKAENYSFPNTNSSPSYSTHEESTSFQNNEALSNKIEQMSSEYCNNIFKENIYEVKTEIDYEINNIETSRTGIKRDLEDVEKHKTIQLNNTENNDKSNNITIDNLNTSVEIKVENDSFPNTNSSPSYSTHEESTSFQNNEAYINNCVKKQYKCNTCQKLFTVKKSLKTHMITHTDNKPRECQKSFSQKENLKRHMYTHSAKKLHKCNICKETFSLQHNLKTHMLDHTGEKKYSCDTCEKSFSLKQNLKTHMLTHTGNKPHRCNICSKLFSQKGNLNTHMYTHTGEKKYSCDTCEKSFSFKQNLKIHMYTHTGEKPYTCDTCQKSFTKNQNLKRHMYTHSGEKPHKCNICKKTFSFQCYLKTHMFTHTGKKPYACNICKKSFSQKSNLNTHLLTHTGKKPYACNNCQKSFSQKSNLITHMFTHTGNKLHRCNICLKLFALKVNLKRHMYTHTGEKPYTSDTCQ